MWTYSEYILFFGFYSFLGWMMETIFASITSKQIVNRGFLTGFFCPLYGFGAILTVKCSALIKSYFTNYIAALIACIITSVILVTVLEYITGFVLEKIFNSKWWDYSDISGNIHGYICIKYSLLWGALAFVLVQSVHPIITRMIFNMSATGKERGAEILLIYFMMDTVKSIIDALELREIIVNYSNLSASKCREKLLNYKRIFLAFPYLWISNASAVNRDIRRIVNNGFDKIKFEIKNKFQEPL